MFHSQNIILYICIKYINIISQIMQLKMFYYFEEKNLVAAAQRAQ